VITSRPSSGEWSLLGVFAPKSSIGRSRESGSLSVFFYAPAASNLSRT
jgi:hypothetical protein